MNEKYKINIGGIGNFMFFLLNAGYCKRIGTFYQNDFFIDKKGKCVLKHIKKAATCGFQCLLFIAIGLGTNSHLEEEKEIFIIL